MEKDFTDNPDFYYCADCCFFIIREIAYRHRSVPDGIIAYESDNPHMADKKTKISAHRSGAEIAPEETLKAFKLCVEDIGFDVDYFEFDLHITKDNVLSLLHDNELDMTSDCEAVFGKSNCRPEDYTYEQLRQLNIGAKFSDENGNQPYSTGTSIIRKMLNISSALAQMRSS